MAGVADSDTFVVLKRRITEIEETLQQQPESLSDSLSSIIVPEESQPSPVVVYPPKEKQESMRNSPNFFKKVKCSSAASGCTTRGAQELGFEENEERADSVRGRITSCDSDSFASKVENFGSDGGLKIEEVDDSVNGLKEEKDFIETEMSFSGIQEFGNEVVSGEQKAGKNEKCEGQVEMDYSVEGHMVEGCATSSLTTLAEEEELLVGTRAESGKILEAKKRQLLAELKEGLIFESRTNVNKVTGSENAMVKNDVYKAIDGTAACSIKIDVIDGTALIDAVQVPKSGNGNENNVERNTKKNEKRDGAAKNPRRTRKKAKDIKMGSEMSVRLRNMTQFVVPQKDVNGIKRMYSREEMEALRFANIREQHLVWRDIYTGLAPALVKEYDELARMKHPKNIHSNLNPGRPFGRKSKVPVFHRVLAAN